MRPTNTRGANRNFHAPENWNPETDGECGVLEVRLQEFGARKLVECVSTWKPSEAELMHLMRGGVIELMCVGAQPPVALAVVDPVVLATLTPSIHDEHGPAAP